MQELSFVHDDNSQRDLPYDLLGFNLRERFQNALFEIAVWSPLHGNTYIRANLKPRKKLNKGSPVLVMD